ncbi:MAG: hypothetical protein GX345_00245 [Clostridiales bacterium]|nr:hypothetical protein [Clostridiales bacterium]
MKTQRIIKSSLSIILTFILILPLSFQTVAMAAQSPCLVATVYETEHAVLADIIATRAPYYADPTGQADAAAAIQKALDDCQAAGGGTVFLPVGEYLVTSSITIPAFVSLHGDWQDPDLGYEYGTIIKAAVESSHDDLPALFTLMGSAGVVGLTVYYPEQSIDDVKPYPYTFYVPGRGPGGYMLQSIINCTVINGYKGIGACFGSAAHEMLTVENFKGTFLCRGADVRNQADVGNWNNVVIANRFWAESGSKSAPLDKINTYTRKHAEGLVFGDLEWTQFNSIVISDRKIGIKVIKGKRIDFAGSLYDIHIDKCDIGILIEALDERWGMLLAKSYVYGSQHSILNQTQGVVKMVDVKLDGGKARASAKYTSLTEVFEAVRRLLKQGLRANKKFLCDSTDLSDFSLYCKKKIKVNPNLFVFEGDKTGQSDISASLQNLLNTAGTVGGLVYLPPGKYLLKSPVLVPEAVELRGSSSIATRDQGDLSLGSLILTDYALGCNSPSDEQALITLSKGAGINGLRIIYHTNSSTKPGALGQVQTSPYAVRGSGEGVYFINSSIVAAYGGIDFRGCDDHLIKRFVGCCYQNAILVGDCKDGVIEACLQNGNAIVRNNLNLPNWPSERDNLFPHIFDTVTRPNTVFIKQENTLNQKVINCFAYGVNSLMETKDSSGLLAVNIGADNIGGTMLKTKGGSASVINMMRWNGESYINQSTSLLLLNRLTIEDRTERSVGSAFLSDLACYHAVNFNGKK